MHRSILLFISFLICGTAFGQGEQSALVKVLSASSEKNEVQEGISETRASALKSVGRSLGLRAGLIDESKLIVREIESAKAELDRKFNFGSLMFSTGALPPVIEETEDVISLMDYSFRTAGKIYRIISPVNFLGANWRNYLYLGLVTQDDQLIDDTKKSVYPRDAKESAYWQKVVTEAYKQGRVDGRKMFEINSKRLERDFYGMRLFYDLYERGLVSAPQIASATESVKRPDPNTLIIGETVFRVTAQPEFQDTSKWKTKK